MKCDWNNGWQLLENMSLMQESKHVGQQILHMLWLYSQPYILFILRRD
jgi:hypothetical protein